jgi:hypothetical protein
MAVVARRVQHRSNLRRRRIARHQIADDGRVCARRIRELQQGEARDDRGEKPFQFSFQNIIGQSFQGLDIRNQGGDLRRLKLPAHRADFERRTFGLAVHFILRM